MRSSDVLWADMPDYFRKAAGYADKIPNGAKHADASLAAGPSRAGDQSQGGEGDGADHSAVSAGHHGRGHRMKPPMSPLMDISMRSADVRFRGNSGHWSNLAECLLMTLSGQFRAR